ncbi:sugar ABC transporter permease [Microbacterium sp. HD4P20]|uniref:carbohydrate ABC transporter permease n=1 Tax=Microbacterium sp. HD4P20 TaxID=2864874 RepID=UPI001C641F2E|nr:sugar ABC transporter permease [Microbacterium sp. HD4P20]MCP2636271.1 sugar ABC transporter permease [Microbacterium sp. HD4P20]
MAVLREFSKLRKGATTATKARPARGDGKAAAVFLLPWFIGLALIVVGPLLASLYLSFTNYDLFRDPEFIGLENYTRLFQDPRLAQSLQVTFTYVFVSVPLQLAAALGLAMVLDKGVRGLPFYRSVFYLPSLLGASVAIAILWRQLFGTDGVLNQAIEWFNGIQPLIQIGTHGWVSDPQYALGTLMVLNVWTFGSPMVIFLAGLRQIPEMYYEAASLDGASKLRQFTSITFPMLTPVVFFNLVLQTINAFQSFTQAFIVSGGTGGPVDSTLFYTLYLYLQGFANFNMGYASAMAWLLVVIIGAMTALNFFASKYWVFHDD